MCIPWGTHSKNKAIAWSLPGATQFLPCCTFTKSTTAKPLHHLIEKDIWWHWLMTLKYLGILRNEKQLLNSEPVLALYSAHKPFTTDASLGTFEMYVGAKCHMTSRSHGLSSQRQCDLLLKNNTLAQIYNPYLPTFLCFQNRVHFKIHISKNKNFLSLLPKLSILSIICFPTDDWLQWIEIWHLVWSTEMSCHILPSTLFLYGRIDTMKSYRYV